MAKKSAPGVPSANLKLYEDLVAANPNVERKGAAMPYTSLNGHMFSFLTETGSMALRLPAEERDAFLKEYKTRLCERHGTVMKEYVVVPDSLLRKTRELKKFFDLSVNHVASLKPKPTTKKKAAGENKPSKKSAARKKAVPRAKK